MAANAVRGERKVSIGGRDFVLVPSFGRLAKVEAAIGRTLVQLLQEIATTQRVSIVDTVNMVEILAREPKLSTDQIGPLVVREGIAKVLGQIAAVVGVALTGEDEPDPAKTDEESGADAPGKGGGEPSDE